ncbi:hypothetical protein [Paenibacillus polymyxa]|uniref:hypothetical protein n=1 Tax=Paenibacillus polymyxa TaxID=1406 RepID=UPI00083E36DC|nr:hypothetical protein [Paenibacillus polymyxa]ODB61384.1 hypothetical protein A7309_15165 [Paenibacillus polymyxa]
MKGAFTKWYRQNKALINLENEIVSEKLSQGVNGIEWLVLNVSEKEYSQQHLKWWIEEMNLPRHESLESVLIDALTMDAESFYGKHECNWWIAVDNTLVYLSLLRDRDYNCYCEILQRLERE